MQWLLIAAVLFVIVAFVLWPRERPRREPQRVILSSPRVKVKNLPGVLTALSSLGLAISERVRLGTEVDLIRAVELRLRPRTQDFGSGFQELVNASGGLLTKADWVTLKVALGDFELSADDMLPLLNAQLDHSKGQFFYVSEEDNEVVFLTPNQVQALTARGWQFQDPPVASGAPPNPPIERTESAASRPTRRSSA